jgi:hypothetical protein
MTDELDPRLARDLWEYSSGGLRSIDAPAIVEAAVRDGQGTWADRLRVWERLRPWLAAGLTCLVVAGLALRLTAPSNGSLPGPTQTPIETPSPTRTSTPSATPTLTPPPMSGLVYPAVAGGMMFSYRLPDPPYAGKEWEPWEPSDGFRLSKNVAMAGQGANAVIFGAGFPDDTTAASCLPTTLEQAGSAEVVAAIAAAPGVDLLEAPGTTMVGGYPAAHVVVAVRDDSGCDPGFVYTWPPQPGGTIWEATVAGDIVRVWVVEVGSRLVCLVAETHPRTMTERGHARLELEIRSIVESIQFE